jgi:3-oxoacyl-[acyl-carrier protein] reductase
MARPAAAGLDRLMSRELSATGVTVNSILIGSTATERNQEYFQWLSKKRGTTFEDLMSEYYADVPMRRPGKPEEMASAVAFLCSDAAGLISGQGILVTGGPMRHIY